MSFSSAPDDEAAVPLLEPDPKPTHPGPRPGSVSPPHRPHISGQAALAASTHSLIHLAKVFLLTSIAAFVFFGSVRWANNFDIHFKTSSTRPAQGPTPPRESCTAPRPSSCKTTATTTKCHHAWYRGQTDQ